MAINNTIKPELISEYYYDDPRAAAYMAQEFGVTFANGDSVQSAVEVISVKPERVATPFYLHEDSVDIFMPQEGDKNINGYVFDSKIQAWAKRSGTFAGEDTFVSKLPEELPIHIRDNKLFFMPSLGKKVV